MTSARITLLRDSLRAPCPELRRGWLDELDRQRPAVAGVRKGGNETDVSELLRSPATVSARK
jgi:hypothetical protein